MSISPQAKAREIIAEAKEASETFEKAAGDLKRSRGFWNIMRKAGPVAQEVVRAVEDLADELPGKITGEEKKAIAMEAIMLLLPDLPWWAPSWLVRMLLGRAIDAAVGFWNEKIGKKWPRLKV